MSEVNLNRFVNSLTGVEEIVVPSCDSDWHRMLFVEEREMRMQILEIHVEKLLRSAHISKFLQSVSTHSWTLMYPMICGASSFINSLSNRK